MLRLAVIAAAVLAGLGPAVAQASRASTLLNNICLANARDGASVADLARSSGATETRNPLWPDYKTEGYPEKVFSWAEAPNTYVFVLASSWANMPARCPVLLLKEQAKAAAEVATELVSMDTRLPGGVQIIVNDNGRMMMLTDGQKQFSADLTVGASRKFGDYALISFSRDPNYNPAPETPTEPAAEPVPTPPSPG